MSDEPPGEKVTMTRTGLVGQACAEALPQAQNRHKMKADRRFILQLPR